MRKLLGKILNRETILYVIFGFMTVIVNYATFWILLYRWGGDYALYINSIAFVVATTFAFLTNKLFVFESRSFRPKTFFRELALFFCARLFSFFCVEQLGLLICRDLLHAGDFSFLGINGIMISKVGLSGVSTVVNYICSKFIIFRKKKRQSNESVTDHPGLQ